MFSLTRDSSLADGEKYTGFSQVLKAKERRYILNDTLKTSTITLAENIT